MYLVSFLFVLIGILLGLLGGGGSILTVPVLVYLADMSAKNAIATSLIVIGTTSLIATFNHAKHQHVCWKTGLFFGSAGMLGAYAGGRLAAYVPDPILLVLLGVVMLLASFSMLFGNKAPEKDNRDSGLNISLCPKQLPVIAIILDGFFLGIITGMVGVGGGFLLVPALTHLAGLPVHAAIGTSLFIISMQSGAALLGHASHFNLDWLWTALVTLLTILGSMIGARLANYLPGNVLKRSFGVFVLLIGGSLLYKEVNPSLIEHMQVLFAEYHQFIYGAIAMLVMVLLYHLWLWLHTLVNRI